ncbi:MAG: tyrosine-type recombinase/integrase [Metamycoplasmataceae bacterium]
MKYTTYLKNKNLSMITTKIYENNAKKWINYLDTRKPNKTLFVKFINQYQKSHKPNSTRLLYSSILAYFKFTKNWKLYNESKDIKLPSEARVNREIISIEEFKNIENIYKANSWFSKRNWIIFTILFMTGIRSSELDFINKKNIINNQIYIKCKGNKYRNIYINDYLINLLNDWEYDKVNISNKNLKLTSKQIIIIVHKIGIKYFNKNITPHSLRRSFATNLLRSNIELKIVSVLMGHSNINTTSRYVYLTDEEIVNTVKDIF